jgi:hypothetical protein
MPKPHASERDFFRIAAQVTVLFGPDTPEARRALAVDQELWQTQSTLETTARQIMEEQPVEEGLKPILAVLRWLDFKSDLILYHLRKQEMRAHFPHQAVTLDLSGSGLALKGDLGLKAGQSVIMSLQLPDAPGRPILAVGEVVRVGPAEGQTQPATAVRFVEISEIDRERIVRYTFQKQRQELARRSEEDSP